MIYLQCTTKMRQYLGLGSELFEPAEKSDAVLGNWTLNLVSLGRTNALLYMNDRTLLSFPITEGKLAVELPDIRDFLEHGTIQLLEMLDAPQAQRTKPIHDTGAVALTKSGPRSILALHAAIAEDYRYRVVNGGGLRKCSLSEIILAVNQTPRSKLGWATSQEVTLALLQSHAA